MIGWIRYFENGGKNMSFKIEMMKCILNIIEFGIKLKNC